MHGARRLRPIRPTHLYLNNIGRNEHRHTWSREMTII